MLIMVMGSQVLESAKAFKPVGAAVCLSSGVVGILRAHGINPTASEYGGVDCTTFQLLTPNSELIATMPFEAGVSIHRGDLHNALFKAATRLDGEGQPAEILMNRRILHMVSVTNVVATSWIVLED
jgi:2-polyprenyl-6-methoxyphenol hydroxylase-like FAD-dependent oxidoreductase